MRACTPMPAFHVWDACDAEDHAAWLERWEAWPTREVFAHPAYVALNLAPSERALCAAYVSADACILYPFVLRDLRTLDAWDAAIGPAFDVTSPYGYAGPFAWAYEATGAGAGREAVAAAAVEFWPAFDRWAAGQPVVSEFVRFSLFADELAPYPGLREERLPNVVRSLDLDDAAIWADVEHKVRKNVQKARRSGVSIITDARGEHLDEFLDVYYGTMRRRGAADAYLFPRAYFERLTSELAGRFCFFHAVQDEVVVSSELVLLSAERVYSFLGGTRAEAFAVRPNDLLKFHVSQWARARGLHAFVLGGGPEPNDGIFRYKLSFAPHGAVPFSVGHRVLRPDLYAELVARRAAFRACDGAPSQVRFPAYRF